jgi:hypothetical protein
MTATFNPSAKRKFTTSHRKEKGGFLKEYAALVPSDHRPGHSHAVVTIRLYWPGSVCYACAWMQHREPFGKSADGYDETHVNGSGSAGGYGYCKQSSAAGEAIANAGFTLSKSIRGVGEQAIEEAVLAIAAACGWPEARLHVSHA